MAKKPNLDEINADLNALEWDPPLMSREALRLRNVLAKVRDYMRDDDEALSREVDPEWADLVTLVRTTMAQAEGLAAPAPRRTKKA